MAEQKDLQQANQICNTVCKIFDEKGWSYKKSDKDDFKYFCEAKHGDLTSKLVFYVDLGYYSQMRAVYTRFKAGLYSPITVVDGQESELAVVLSVINSKLVYGSFHYDDNIGFVSFCCENRFLDTGLGEGTLRFMIDNALSSIEKYYDSILLVAEGAMDSETFITFA